MSKVDLVMLVMKTMRLRRCKT